MGYYADGSGAVTFQSVLSDADIEKLRAVLDDGFFEYDVYHNAPCSNYDGVDLWSGDKYHDDEAWKTLNSLVPFGIRSGEIEYVGEDRSFWRFIWKESPDGGFWKEQSGWVEYEE